MSKDDEVSLKDFVEAKLDVLRSELRWQRWALAVVAAISAAPKLGGPDIPTVTAHVVSLVA